MPNSKSAIQPEAPKLTPTDEVCLTIIKASDQYKMALPPHIPPERFVRVAITAIRQTPELINCERQSLYASLMRCAQDGLLPDGRDAAIVPWGKKATYMPMIGGLCKKARNSGEILSIDSAVVYENDEYEAWADEKGPHFKHKKARQDRGKPILTYAYAITKEGGFYFEEVTDEEMAKIESAAKAVNSPWKGPFRDEMKRKSAIRRLVKYRLPSSTDLDAVVRSDDELYDSPAGEKPQERSEPQTTSRRLNATIVETEKAEPRKLTAEETEILNEAQEEAPI